ncbi:DUF6544 family protein [Egicoccus sp. AB-alg2]|uniref:DUF6544 family protein n=1 Tax=Egicoccus sp. AB-alg2 TaxID=3242693 RepID=UPI00359D1EA0
MVPGRTREARPAVRGRGGAQHRPGREPRAVGGSRLVPRDLADRCSARWEPVDTTSARLIVPFGDDTEVLTVTFDPGTGLLERMESMRFKDETDDAKVLWTNQAQDWDELGGMPVPLRTAVTWADEGTPWARLRTEGIVIDADLDRSIEQAGP